MRQSSWLHYTARIGVDDEGLGRSAAHYALHILGEGAKAIEIFGFKGSTPNLTVYLVVHFHAPVVLAALRHSYLVGSAIGTAGQKEEKSQ